MKKVFLLAAVIVFAACSRQKPGPEVTVNEFTTTGKGVTVYTTADSSDLRLTQTDKLQFSTLGGTSEREIYIFADPSRTFQTMLGIGGALTDASAETFARIPAEKQDELIRAYYDPDKGIGYTLARTNINSCDFSSRSYTYVDEGDKELVSFNIDHDRQYKIPLIKRAIDATGGKLTLFASPWSPPAFMKDNNNMLRGGKLKSEFYQSWATYYASLSNTMTRKE